MEPQVTKRTPLETTNRGARAARRIVERVGATAFDLRPSWKTLTSRSPEPRYLVFFVDIAHRAGARSFHGR